MNRLWTAVRARALNAACELPFVNPELAKHFCSIQLDGQSDLLAELKREYPLEDVSSQWHRTTAEDVTPRFWTNVKNDDTSNMDNDQMTDPIPKFNRMVNDETEDRVAEGILFLLSRVPGMIARGDCDLAVRSIKRAREVAVLESHSLRFNCFLIEMKRQANIVDVVKQFWIDYVVKNTITLISTTEDADSAIDPGEALKFIEI